MPNSLRFNAKELEHFARLKSCMFDKEGTLFIKERQDGLFRKSEVYLQKLFRLRGNLLFYFKTCDMFSEVSGVYVLERCMVQLDTEEQLPFSFILAFESDDKVVQLAAGSEEERDSWIEHLHIASYECMQMQLNSLREQILAKTGRDPIDNPEPSSLPELASGSNFETVEPFIEMCISCDGLPAETNGKEPDTFASVHYITPPNKQWIPHAHTEIVERNCKPCYLATIGFSNPEVITLATKLKLIVYDVKERMTNTMTQIGHTVFTINELLNSYNSRIKVTLMSSNGSDMGHVTVMAWQNDATFIQRRSLQQVNGHLSPELLTNKFGCIKSGRTKRTDMLKTVYDNIITKAFCFPTNGGQQLRMHEYMAESKLTFLLPRELLKMWVTEEKQRIEILQDLGKEDIEALPLVHAAVTSAGSMVNYYNKTITALKSCTGAPFKPSVKKSHKELEFAPVNLHVHRMWVYNDVKQTSACNDVTTSGAFTAFAQKYKQGGLRRLLRQLRDSIASNQQDGNVLDTINELLNNITLLREAVHKCCDIVCHQANQGEGSDLLGAAEALADKTRQLISVCENSLIEKGCAEYAKSRIKAEEPKKRPKSDTTHLRVGYTKLSNSGDKSPDKSWKWSGTDFVKSPTEEPFELTRLNTEAAVMCVSTQVEELTHNNNMAVVTQWLEDLSPLVIKLEKCVEVMCARAKSSLNFLTLHICGSNVALLHSIKYRRDVVFAQALTTAVTAFTSRLRSCLTDEHFLEQLVQIGILMEFESLLSCYGDEMGMLEDMAVGVADLSCVTFKVRKAEKIDDILPVIEGNRPGYTLHIPVPEAMFTLFPRELQRGHGIKICPVLFSVGINEQATLAERFGSLSVQEEINAESLKRLHSYYEKYTEILVPDELDPLTKGMSHTLGHQMTKLSMNVTNRKSKNCEVLYLAAEISRKLKGLRFTCCKSGKDRTSMGATLEQVQVLQSHHDLAAHVFTHALECTRSEGVRRENTLKNCGVRKYAFNSLQLMSFPKLYRPPHGTYGVTIT